MGDQTAQFTEEYCAEKMKIIALIIALLVAVAASSEISGDSNERVVPEESLVATSDEFVPVVHPGPPVGTVVHHGGFTSHKLGANRWGVTGHHKVTVKASAASAEKAHKMVKQHIKMQSKKHIFKIHQMHEKSQKQMKKHFKKHKSLVKKHVKSVKNLFSKVKRLAKKGKKGAIKKPIKKHVRKLKRRVNKHVKRHFRRGRSSRRSRRSIRQRGTKWECSWNHNPWFPCTPRPGDVVVPPYNGYWTKSHRSKRVVPEESLVSEGFHFVPGNHGNTIAKGYHYHPPLLGHHKIVKKHVKKVVKKHVSKIVKKHKKSVTSLFKKVKKLAKKGKTGAIKKLVKKHVRKLKRRVNKHFKRHFRRSRRSSRRSRRSSRRGRRSIRQRGTKWECSWNHNPWFPCTPRPGDVVVPPYNGYWTRRHRKRSVRRRL